MEPRCTAPDPVEGSPYPQSSARSERRAQQQVGDLWWPFYVMAEEKVFSREYLYEKVELNPELDPMIFERPE